MPIWGQRRSKPNPGVAIDWGVPQAQRLALAVPINEGAGPSVYDVVNGTSFPLNASATWANSPHGWALSSSAAMTTNTLIAQAINPPYSVTVLARGPGNVTSVVVCWDNSLCGLWWNTASQIKIVNAATGTAATWTCPTQTNLWHMITVTFDGTAAGSNAVAYMDGVSLGATTTSGTVNAPTRLTVGARANGTSNPGVNGPVALVLYHSRLLTLDDVVSLHANPWQLFAPSPSYWLIKPAGTVATRVRRSLYDRAGSRGVA